MQVNIINTHFFFKHFVITKECTSFYENLMRREEFTFIIMILFVCLKKLLSILFGLKVTEYIVRDDDLKFSMSPSC